MLRRWTRRALFAIGLLLVAAMAALVLALRTGVVRELVRVRTVAALAALTDADVRIGSIGGSLLHTLVVDDLRVAVEGRTVVRVPRVEIAYALLPLLRGTLRIDRIVLAAPRVRAVRTAGHWRLPAAREGGGRGPALRVVVHRLAIDDGRVSVALLDATPPRRFAAASVWLEASGELGRRRRRVEIAALRLVPRGVALSPVEMAGAATADPGAPARLDRLAITTGRSRITASGAIEPGYSFAARLDLAPLAAADVDALVPAARLTADVRLHARAGGPWHGIRAAARADLGEAGRVGVSTTVDASATPFGWSGRIDLDALDPGAAVATLPRATIRGRAEGRGAGLDARGPLAYRAALHDSVLGGRAIDRLAVTGTAEAGRHRLRARAAAPVGDVRLAGHVTLAATPIYGVDARWTVSRLDLVMPSTWGWAVGRARVSGRGTEARNRRATAAVAIRGASIGGLPVDGGAVRARIVGSAVRLRRVALDGRELGLRVEGAGHAELEKREAALTANAEVDLGAVGTYLARPVAGRLRASATIEGPLEALAVGARASIEEGAYSAIAAESVTTTVDLRGVGGPAAEGKAALHATGFRLRAGQRYDGRLGVDWQRRAGGDRATVGLAATGERGAVQQLEVTLARTPVRTAGTVTAVTLTPPEGPPWRLVRPASFVLDAGFATEGIVLAAGAQRVALTGRIGLRGPSDATLRVEHVALGPLSSVAGGPPCAGDVSGDAGVTGDATAPVARAALTVEGLEVAGVAYGMFSLDGRYAERVARLHASLRHPQAGELVAEGAVPVDLAWAGPRRDLADAPLTLTARAEGLDLTILRALAPATLKSSAGRIALDVRVTGSRAAPRAEGTLAVDDAEVELAAAGLPYEKITARIAAHGTRVEIRSFQMTGGNGTLSLSGGAEIAPVSGSAVDVRVRFDRFLAIRRADVEAQLSGDLTLRGPLSGPNLDGRLDVDRAVVRPAGLPGSSPGIARDPTITVVGVPVAPGTGAASVTMPRGALTMSVTVAIARNAWIRRADADIEIGGEIAIEKAADEPVRIVGEIRLLRGWYVFQGRRFTIEQGTITFTGSTLTDATFDVTASYRHSDYRIEVHVTGSAKKPNLTLSSDPPLEQADILSVILFGKPSSQLGKGQSVALQQQALGLAAGYAIPELRMSVMDALGLDTLDVEMPEGQGPGRVSAGRYLAEDVFVSLGQEFGRRAAEVMGVEYSITSKISVRGSTTTRGDSAVDLFWRHRY